MLHEITYTAIFRICQNLESVYESKILFWNDPAGRLPHGCGGNPMEMKICLILLFAVIVAVAAAKFYHEYMTMHQGMQDIKEENGTLKTDIDALKNRMQQLELANRKRMPYESADSVLDAMATLDALEHAEQFRQDLIQNAKAHLIKSMSVGTKRSHDQK